MTTARDQIYGALRLIGMLAEGETPSAETTQDCLSALNQMLDSWSIEELSAFATQDQVYTWPAGQLSQTIGPTGDFVALRPVLFDDATYFKDPTNGISYGIKIINQQQYNGIAVKTVTSTYPQVLWVNADMPNSTMSIYPVPTRALEWHFVSLQPLTQVASLSTALSFPPGYLRAFKYNLALEIASEFGVQPSAQVQRIAMTSKRSIKRINCPMDQMSMPYALVSTRQKFNVFAGNL